jgi:23S rRNA (guanine2445-N2)-methyltransferase / 23S rRNA (guanine2069-N7)-methyltransferase
MCGPGTLVIEAAMIAANVAPGARRHYFGFQGWVGHDRAAWEKVKQAALAREIKPTLKLRGVDADGSVLHRRPRENADARGARRARELRARSARGCKTGGIRRGRRLSSRPIHRMAFVSKIATPRARS